MSRSDRALMGFWFWYCIGLPIVASAAIERFAREEWAAWQQRRVT